MPTKPMRHNPLPRVTARHLGIGSQGWGTGRGGATWMRTRARILRRDMHCCQPCARRGATVQALEVDHIVPIAQGGTDDHANLQAICKPCHAVKTAGEASRGQWGAGGTK